MTLTLALTLTLTLHPNPNANPNPVFQGVHDQIQFTPAKEPWGPNEVKQSKVVFIGRHLDRPTLAAGFALCSAKPDEL